MLLKFKNNINEIGLDEAGRGPLLGRVYAGAVIWDNDLECELINDSKKLSKVKRKKAFEWIMNNIKYWGVGYSTEDEIDKINILEATKLAMDRAIENLEKKIKNSFKITNLIIDGCYWEKKKFTYPVESVIKGDSKYYSIACASIIAKEFHDNHIKDIIEEFPDLDEKYALSSNMGYPTKKHREGIKKFGICDFHRKSFKV